MKCSKCGSELIENASFCSACGTKVEGHILLCTCGKELKDDMLFCPYCGKKIGVEEETPTSPDNEIIQEQAVPTSNNRTGASIFEVDAQSDIWKSKAKIWWERLSTFSKFATVGLGISVLLILISLIAHRILSTWLIVIQIIGYIVALLLNAEKIKHEKKWIKYVVLFASYMMIFFYIWAFPVGQRKAVKPDTTSQQNVSSASKITQSSKNEEKVVSISSVEVKNTSVTSIEEVTVDNELEDSADVDEKQENDETKTISDDNKKTEVVESDDSSKADGSSDKTDDNTSSSTSVEKKKDDSVSYSTNTKDTVKYGNAGKYSYKKSGTYDIYYIIDFDEGYVYWFTEGIGDTYGDKVKIVSGDLNSVLIVTYNDYGNVWSYGLHFKYKNQPDHLIMQDEDGFEYDFYATDLDMALEIMETKTLKEF